MKGRGGGSKLQKACCLTLYLASMCSLSSNIVVTFYVLTTRSEVALRDGGHAIDEYGGR